MIYRLAILLEGAKHVFQTEGLMSLLGQGAVFLVGPFFRYGTYYCYEHALKDRNEADFMPRTPNFTFKIISTRQQVDELAADGFKFPYIYRNKLDKGAIAFCVFVSSELAHIGYVAMTDEAKKSLNELPYQVDFSNNEAVTGGTWSKPKYRGMGLMTYGYFKRFQFLREKGVTVSRNAVATSNIASQRVHAKFTPRIHAKGRFLKVLWWQSWTEKPLLPD